MKKLLLIETSKGVTQDLTAHNESGLNLHNYDQMYQAWSNHLRNQVTKGMRSIAISHAFVMGGEVGGSERTLSVVAVNKYILKFLKTFTIQPLDIYMARNEWGQIISAIAIAFKIFL